MNLRNSIFAALIFLALLMAFIPADTILKFKLSPERMLAEVANHYSKEVDYRSRHLAALLEPILTIVLGVFVLIVALAIFLPMWNLIQVFRG